MGMLFPGVVAAAVLMAAVQQGECLGVSSQKLCQDAECSVAISDAVAVSEYDHGSIDSRFLSFPKGANVVVYSKAAGSRQDLWSGEYDGKKGFFSKSYVKETTVYHSEPSFVVPVEDEDEEEVIDDIDSDDTQAAADEESTGSAFSDNSDDAGIAASTSDKSAEPIHIVKSEAEPVASRLPPVADGNGTIASSSNVEQLLSASGTSPDVSGSIAISDALQQQPAEAASAASVGTASIETAVELSSDTATTAADDAGNSDRESDARPGDGGHPFKLHPTPVINSSASTVPIVPNETSNLPSTIETDPKPEGKNANDNEEDEESPADAVKGDLRSESSEKGTSDNQNSHAVPPVAGRGDVRGETASLSADTTIVAGVAGPGVLNNNGTFTAGPAEASATEPNRTSADAGTMTIPGGFSTAEGNTTDNAASRDGSPTADGSENINATDRGDLPTTTGNETSDSGHLHPLDGGTSMPNSSAGSYKEAQLQAGNGTGLEQHYGVSEPPPAVNTERDLPPIKANGGKPGDEHSRSQPDAHRSLHDRLLADQLLLNRVRQLELAKRNEASGDRLPSTDIGQEDLRSSGAVEERSETLGDGTSSSLSSPDRLGPADDRTEATSDGPGQSADVGVDDVVVTVTGVTTDAASGAEEAEGSRQSSGESRSSSNGSGSNGSGSSSSSGSSSTGTVNDATTATPVLVDVATEQQLLSSEQQPQPDAASPVGAGTTVVPAASHFAGGGSSSSRAHAADAIDINYASVLAGYEQNAPVTNVEQLELQLWRIAAGLPSFVQQVMQAHPLGLEPPMFVLANLISLWLLLCSAFAVCFTGCCDNRAKAKSADARCTELYKQLSIAEVEVKELQATLQEAERRSAEEARESKAHYETRIGTLEDQVKALQEEAEAESQRWSSLAADGEEKLRQATAELDSSRTLVTQWQAYAQDLDAKLKAALALGPDLEARCLEAESLSQSHREKAVTLETTIVRLEEEVLLLKQERDHLNAEAADRDEKARELEARLQQQDVERSELRAAVAACELKTASLRESYQLLLLAGGGVGDAAGDGSLAMEDAATGETESEERTEVGLEESADATGHEVASAADSDRLGGENGDEGNSVPSAHPTTDRAKFVRCRQSAKVVEQHLRQLEDAAKARQELEDLREQSVSQKEQLRLAQASLLELEDLSRKHLAEKSELVSEISALKRAKDEADTSLKVLTAYFKEKEAELQRTLGEREHSSRTSGANVIELQQKYSQLQTERDQLHQEVRDVRDEMRATEKDLRKRLLENEKKAYDAWVLQRNKERELAAQQTECSQLRQKLLDAELARTKQNEALSELRLQLELEKAKCQEANAALAAANAAAAASAAVAATTAAPGDSAFESGLSLESGSGVVARHAGPQRPTSRSSAAPRPPLPPPPPVLPPLPPVLPPLPLLPPLRPPLLPPFGMAPSMPPLPPPGVVPMVRPTPHDRRSMSPTIGERPLPRQMMTPPVEVPAGGVAQPLPPMLPPAMLLDPRLRAAYGGVQDHRDSAAQLPPMHPHHTMPPTFDGVAGAPPPLLLPPPSHGVRGAMGPHGMPHFPPPHVATATAFDPRVDGFGSTVTPRLPPGAVDPGRQFVPVEAQPFLGRDPGLPPAASSPLQRYAAASAHVEQAAGRGVRMPESPINLSAISNDARNASLASESGSGRNAGYGLPPAGYGAPSTGDRV